MRLLRDQIILRPDEDEDEDENKTSSGIILAAPKQTLLATGEVVQVGEYSRLNLDGSSAECKFGTGDRVLYRKHQVEEFEMDGGETGLKLTTQSAIIGVIES